MHIDAALCIPFDLESDGLLDEVARVHVLRIGDKTFRRRPEEDDSNIRAGVRYLCTLSLNSGSQAPAYLVGHNVIGYDIPVLRKLYPEEMRGFREDSVVDTLVLARLYYPDIKKKDLALWKAGRIPGNLIGRHSLEAWGHRLGVHKGEFKGPWHTWTQEMEDYCVQDVVVTETLLHKLLSVKVRSDEAELLETQVQWIIARQERRGFAFDERKAASLYAALVQERNSLTYAVRAIYPTIWLGGKVKIPKKNRKERAGRVVPLEYTAGGAYTPIKEVEFNPSSRDHIAAAFIRFHGWKPRAFTEDGKPQVDDNVLRSLSYPGVEDIARYMLVEKRIGQLAEGKEAWLRHVKNGAVYGRVVTNGAVTGRMAHMNPNLGQVPAVRSPYGRECRELYCARAGLVLVGIDASGLELRGLAGYMAIYDGGAYVKVVLDSDDPAVKAAGGDMHSQNCRGIGLDPKGVYFETEKGRDLAKTWFYAFLYGAGPPKLGSIVLRLPEDHPKCAKLGAETRAKFLKSLPALQKLIKRVQDRAKKRGYLLGLDGRPLYVRSSHAALNTLLQGAGAIIMKRALVLLDSHLQQKLCLTPGVDYEFVANVHDEWQIEARPDVAEAIGEAGRDAIRLAGESFGFRCPLTGEFAVGPTWADTH